MGSIFWRRTLTTGSLASVAVLLSGLIALSPSGAQAANVVQQPAEITVVADDGEGDHPETTAEDDDGGEADHPETLADGGFRGELPARGYGFVVAEGGTVSQLHRALVRAGADLAAVTEGGEFVVYLPEAQAADNQAFVDLFRDSIPAGRLMIVRIRGEGAGADAFACGDSLPDAALVIVSSPTGGEEVANGFTVRGCSRTFESNVQWRLLGRTGEELASGFAMGGGVDGPAPFVFAVEYEAAERQLAHLEVFEEDVSGGQGFPPPRAVVPLVIASTE